MEVTLSIWVNKVLTGIPRRSFCLPVPLSMWSHGGARTDQRAERRAGGEHAGGENADDAADITAAAE
jgi:hypothetical protein